MKSHHIHKVNENELLAGIFSLFFFIYISSLHRLWRSPHCPADSSKSGYSVFTEGSACVCTVVQPHNFRAPMEGVDQQDCEVGQSVEGTLRETRLVSLGFCMLFICAYRNTIKNDTCYCLHSALCLHRVK